MHTAILLVCGVLTGWVAWMFVRADDGTPIALYIAISTAGASLGLWLIDVVTVISGHGGDRYPGARVLLSFCGSVLMIWGFQSIW